MPVLPILDGHGALKEEAAFICWATMLFPDDEEERERTAWLSFVAALIDDLATAGKQNVVIGIDELAELMAAPQPDQVSAAVDPRIARGGIAGDVLRHIVLLSVHYPEQASVLKGVYIKSQQLARYITRSGARPPASRSSVMGMWSQYRSVAHLWAAFINFADLAEQIGVSDFHFVDAPPEALLDHLALAEWFRQRGESIFPRAQNVPILDPSATWRVPKDLKLPELRISVPALTEETRQTLRQYRAPKSD